MFFFFTIRFVGVGVCGASLTLGAADCTLGVLGARGESGVFLEMESVDGLETCFFTESGLCGTFFLILAGDFGTLFSADLIGLGAVLLLGIDISSSVISLTSLENGSLNRG